MSTARLYQPSCVFFEDVDSLAAGDVPEAVASSKSDSVSKLLDLFDGINAKGTEIMAVLTTNHAERIHKGMVRPGRLDAVIHIGAPDSDGVRRFIETSVASHLLADDIDFDQVGKAMDGFFPAFITESIDRAKRYNISHNGGVPSLLSTEDFVEAAEGLKPQLQLMSDAPETPPIESLDAAFQRTVEDVAHQVTKDMLESVAIRGVVQSPHVTLEVGAVKDGEVIEG
jgi:transitional endoplasmic reticulum ATPase